MADRTLDARNGRQEEAAAAEGTPAAAPAPASLASNPWLPLIITAIIMPALAFATTRYFLLPQMKKALYKPTMAAAAAQAEPTGTNGAGGSGAAEGAIKVT
ncbi:MAG TPA: hypothetical protein VK731_03650, partial [Candidatus Cybelea sp.]|nr:hypothetical protein [Candidatus Cybelea sp.]